MTGTNEWERFGVVHVVDHDVDMMTDLSRRLGSLGFAVRHFRSPKDFVQMRDADQMGCLLLSVEFPSANGLEFQAQLPTVGIHMPVILMAENRDVRWSIRGMKAGAVDFLLKPLEDVELVSSIRLALRREHERHHQAQRRNVVAMRFAALTQREQQVMGLVVRGLMNKQIAAALNLSEITVKVHRGTMMRKMAVRSVADLVRAAELVELDARPDENETSAWMPRRAWAGERVAIAG
ncbi:response regulator transcription factor [Bradyrhizobium sp. 48]|uniref:response regulator transcription factor n=1 Tax=Bradyrhizobium sp. 48 TaxID=2782676 RepID=UPI001FF9907C|nr:LuxR C-terminal-related transcriptional regulator [Bradyrhizobium sp. 48]MCK1446712.1 response regulator transcription factor [Bradyrhizobium sp. 48]